MAHFLNSARLSFKFNIALYSGRILKDDVAVSGEISQRPGPRTRTFLYVNTDSSQPISVSNTGSETTELYLFYPLLAQGMRDQGYGSLSVRASEAEIGVWILQVADYAEHEFARITALPQHVLTQSDHITFCCISA